MSITGSLISYENNNELSTKHNNNKNNKQKRFSNNNNNKRNSILVNSTDHHQHHMGKSNCNSSLNSSILSSSVITSSSGSFAQQQQQSTHHSHHLAQKLMNSKRKHAKYNNMHPSHLDQNNYLHLNSLWSIWYGVLLTLFQGYLAVHGAYRFIGCSLIPWKIEPVAELNLQIVLSGVVFILLPFFFTSAVFKVGNLANDGIKLATGSKGQRCSMSPHDGLDVESHGGTLRALWTHGGPTAAFVHILIAMCLLLPRLLLEARIIENGLLPREHIWQTELDFIAVNRRNLMVLSVVSSPYQNTSSNVLDYEEDYYNDTMFTAFANGGGNKGTDSSHNNNNNNRIGNSIVVGGINNNLLDTNTKTTKKSTTTTTTMTRKQAGKTMFFEVPDLINREPKNPDDDNMNTTELDGEGEGEDEAENDDGEEDRYGQRGSLEDDRNSNEFLRPSSEITSWATNNNNNHRNNKNNKAPTMGKNYDENWDKLAMVGKGNSLNGKTTQTTIETQKTGTGTTRKVPPSAVGTTTTTTTTTLRPNSSTRKSTTAGTTTTTTTTRKATTSTTTTEAATTTSTNTPITASTTTTELPTTQPTRMHQHHNHHNNHQSQHHSNGAGGGGGVSSKSTRKHSSSQRQHRQRSQNHHNHRRHHQQTTTTTTTSGARTNSAELYGPSSAAGITKSIHWNRLDDGGGGSGSGSAASSGAISNEEDLLLDYGQRHGNGQPRATTTTTQTTRDSNIHIVKPEKLPEIIPSTPVSSNSKIIEIKTNSKRMRRMTASINADDTQVEIEPDYLLGDMPSNENDDESDGDGGDSTNAAKTATTSSSTTTTATNLMESSPPTDGIVRLDGFAGMLQIFFGIEKAIDVHVFAQPPSAEFVNLLFALLVWCVRYPAVFWTTTKAFGCIFSIQMITAALDIIFSYVGISSLYKLQVYSEAMPVQNSGLILNGVVTMALFLLSSVLIIASSMIMYLYGHGRLAAKMRDRSLITLKSTESWIYFAHCASFCFVLALAVVKAPLLNDLSVTYKSNLHCATFLSALVSVVHILLWIVIWLVLTVKRRWSFKLPPVDTYGIITKASTQPLLMSNRNGSNAGSIPSSGSGSTTQGAIIGGVSGMGGGAAAAAGNAAMSANIGNGSLINEHKGGGILSAASSTDGGVDDIYWPKLTPSSPKLKVTFNEVTSTSDDVLLIGDHETQTDGKRHTTRGTAVCFTSVTGEIDDGEYATLRAATAATVVGIGIGGSAAGGGSSTNTMTTKILHLSEYDELPPPPPPLNGNHLGGGAGVGDDNLSEEGKLLACVRDDSVTYASTRDLEPPHPHAQPPPPPLPPHAMAENYDDLSPTTTISSTTTLTAAKIMCIGGRAPQAMPEIMQLSSSPEHLVSPLAPVTVTVHTNEAHISSSSTPRCLRRADSGVPNEALTPRSDTTSTTESTTSPPERAPSESSSGVHSGEERDVEVVIRPRVACKPPPKPPQPPIQEEPYGRCTNMRMSSFVADPMTASRLSTASNSATLPMQRSQPEQKFDYANHCSTMPLPLGGHHGHHGIIQQHGGYSTSSAYSMLPEQQQQLQQQLQQHISSFKTQVYANSAVAMAGATTGHHQQQQQGTHTTLPNGVRYSNPHQLLRRLPHVTKAAESPYGHLGYGAGHHTFSKLMHDPMHNVANTTIPEDRDSANYSMSSEQDSNLYATANHMH